LRPPYALLCVPFEMDAPTSSRADPEPPLVRAALRTPRAAAIAGIVFSLTLIASFWLLQISVPKSRFEVGEWLRTNSERIVLALNLIPIAGVAFLWFLGVLRDRLGAMEDKFFASVFLGSALLFLGMLFVAASAGGALVGVYAAAPNLADPSGVIFARAFSYDVMNIYALKMAAVFMVTTSTLALRTRITANWIAWIGYAAAAFVLIGSSYFGWAFFVFPLWVLLVSAYILVDNLRKPPGPQ
jgi:hypothetical protein